MLFQLKLKTQTAKQKVVVLKMIQLHGSCPKSNCIRKKRSVVTFTHGVSLLIIICLGSLSQTRAETGYQGCYQDCGTTSSGETIQRVCDDVALVRLNSAEECRTKCSGFKFMGLACPDDTLSTGQYECWCCNTLDKTNNGNSAKIPDKECTHRPSDIGLDPGDGCPTSSPNPRDGYPMGAA